LRIQVHVGNVTPGATSEACEHEVHYMHVAHSQNKAHKGASNKGRGLCCMLYSPAPENKACNEATLSLVKAALWPFFDMGTTCM
jgi:hypothetical protein